MTAEEEIGNITDYLTDSFHGLDLRVELSQPVIREKKTRGGSFVYSVYILKIIDVLNVGGPCTCVKMLMIQIKGGMRKEDAVGGNI